MIKFLIPVVGYITVIMIMKWFGRKANHHAYTAAAPVPKVGEDEISFYGNTLQVTDQHLNRMLMKRSPYYAALEESLKTRFIKRLQAFIRSKIFIIKDEAGFKEMPVLISAAAIQITFGLRDYMLPFYRHIQIFPEEYVVIDRLKVLAGNVQGNTITVAWSHFLKGFEDPADGSNLGLHEMSHALYFQKLVIDEEHAKKFCDQYEALLVHCDEAHQHEVQGRKDLYSKYAETNLQEFWAESVELFFEKQVALENEYPNVFNAMTLLLNQDPRIKENPLLHRPRDFREQMMALAGQLKNISFLNRKFRQPPS